MVEEIIVGVIVFGAAAWLARGLVTRARRGTCGCASALQCPYAGGDGCALGESHGSCTAGDYCVSGTEADEQP